MKTVNLECPTCKGDGHIECDAQELPIPCVTCEGFGQVTYDIVPKVVTGDVITLFDQGEFDIIYPGGNHCFCRPEQGLAGKVMARWPEYQRRDLQFGRKGDRTKLGICLPITVDRECGSTGIIVLSYTQYKYGRYNDASDLASYNAIHEVFKQMVWGFSQSKIGLAKIGSELGNGDWEVINILLELEMKCYFEKTGQVVDITVVEFEG
ncbi:hypothetical protein [Ewingella americana]|uniref:Uncharacterized protein n=1 Tax=Ewingella americana TaxID=41202 RepID=A0A502GDS3_9GAMM|nr:hypothetical protein [Ewingella americana]TPG59901.1 hypothetical protein EAH77_15150 [Ewingella americana]